MARERIGAGRSAPLRPAARLVSSCHAAAAVEYALVVGLIVGAVATGALLVGREVDRVMARVAHGDPGAGGADRVPDVPRRPARAAALAGEPCDGAPSASLVDRYASYGLAVAFGGLMLALAATYLGHRHRKRRAVALQDEPHEEEPHGATAQMRLHAKRQRLWQALLSDSDLLLKNRLEVRHLMTREATIVAPKADLAEMHALMTSNRVRHLLVCDGGGRLLGIISDRDLRGKAGGTARELMTRELKTVSPHTALGAAITCLIEEGISCLPVVNGPKVCGVLTTTDLVLTLHCALQVWLRVARTVDEGPQWAERLGGISAAVDQNLAHQHTRLAALCEQLAGLAARDGGPPREALSGELEGMLRTGAQLVRQVDDARQQIRRHTEDLIGLVEAHNDHLTGLGTVWELTGTVDLMLAIRARYGHALSVVMLTLDHPRGDPPAAKAGGAWRALVETVVEVARASDFVARYRKGTLAVVLPHADSDGAGVFCRRVEHRVCGDGRLGPDVALRAGVSTAVQDDDSAALLARADVALDLARTTPGDSIRRDTEEALEPAGQAAGN